VISHYLKSAVLLAFVALGSAACGDDGGGGSAADAVASADADPNAPDANPNASDANATTPDAGSTGDIACGDTMTCTGGQVCCTTQGGGGGGFSQMCTASDQCTGAPSTCDGPEDCNGTDVCCAGQQGAQCQAAGGMCQFALCHTVADCTGMGQMCCPGIGGADVCSPFCL
jgi:hypothetical protein